MMIRWALSIFLVVAFSGCQTSPKAGSHLLHQESFSLSAKKPKVQLGNYTVNLVSIEAGGVTKIHVTQTGKDLTAAPGEYFVSYEFGQLGLKLVAATNGVARFFSVGCEAR